MILNDHNVVLKNTFGAWERIELRTGATKAISSATEPLAYVSIDILVHHINSNKSSLALLERTDRLMELSKTVYLWTTTAHDIHEVFTGL